MKKIFLSIAILFSAFISDAQFTSAKLTAAGLTCAVCTRAIYDALEKIPSVDKVDADIKNSFFIIHFKGGANIDPDVFKAAVEEAGFSISKLSLTGNFNNIAISNNAHVNIGGRIYHFLHVKNNTTLNGLETLNMVDRKFVSSREFKKYEVPGEHMCIESGKTEPCCPKSLVAVNSRIYHVTL